MKNKQFIKWISTVCLLVFIAACSPQIASTTTSTSVPTNYPTRTPKLIPTKIPTNTPIPELNPSFVGLPWDNNSATAGGIAPVIYKPCYVNTDKRWHAGDVFQWTLKKGQVLNVVSATDGEVIYLTMMGETGGNIFVRTPFIKNNKPVFYQLRHFASPDPSIQVGTILKKGQVIGTSTWNGPHDPGGYQILDFMLLSAPNIYVDNATSEGRSAFFDTAPYTSDDLKLIPHKQIARCSGNPLSDYSNFQP